MRLSMRNKKTIKIVSMVAGILIVLLLLMFNSGIAVLRNISGVVIYPVQRVGSSIIGGIGGFFGNFGNSAKLSAENVRLNAIIAEQETKLALSDKIEQDNKQLQELLGFTKENPSLTYMQADVVARNTENYSVTFSINRGSKDGIAQDMPVIAVGGLAGRVVDVRENWSLVLAITDSRSAVSALVSSTRDTGIIKGIVSAGVQQNCCSMVNLPIESKLRPGDTIITSGMDSVFPKGLHIGEVIEVAPGSTQLQSYAVVRPFVDLQHIEQVLVITSQNNK